MHLIQTILIHQEKKGIPQESESAEESKSSTMTTAASSVASDKNEEPAAQDQIQEETQSTSSLSDENPDQADQSSVDESAVSAEDVEVIALATKAADENYVPSQSLLSSSSPYPLIRSVDGISLKRYNPDPSRFSAKDVIVPLRGELTVPIHVVTSGSVVDYTVQSKDFDIGFGIVAEREEGVTVVKEKSRQDSHRSAIKGRFLVGSVPCAIIFTFDNEYSWFREKKVTYKIKVTPPSFENIYRGRRTRAKAALLVVSKDKESAETRLENVTSKQAKLLQDIERLETELLEKKKSLGVVEKEENWLKERVQLRDVQEDLLTRRLTEGWEDEKLVEKKVSSDQTDDGESNDDDASEGVEV